MDKQIENLVGDCINYADSQYVIKHLNGLPEELRAIYNDKDGKQILEAGVALFAYLADVIKMDLQEGVDAWGVVYKGYPGHPHTDLFGPYFDVCRTQLLWYNASDKLVTAPHAKAEIILNVYLRWYIAAMELGRKMFLFATYCRSKVNKQPLKLERYLFQDGNPGTVLKNWGPLERAQSFLNYYKPEFRHAIAHGNVVIAVPQLVAVRLANDERSSINQVVYPTGPSSTSADIDRLVQDLQANANPIYQMIRVFFFLYIDIQNRHTDVFKSYIGQYFNDPVLIAMVQTIQADPGGFRDWQ